MTTSTTTLGPAIRTLSRLARVLERGCADGDLSLPQYRLLAMVASGGQRSTALAERLAVAKPTVTAMVDSLVERGLLCRSDVAGDRRAVRITITVPGRRALRQAEAAIGLRLDGLLDRVTDRASVLAAVDDLGAALDARSEERLSGAGR